MTTFRWIMLVLGVAIIIAAAFFLASSLAPKEGLILRFPEDAELDSEALSYLSAIVPQEWLTQDGVNPRYELSIEPSYRLSTSCRAGERSYVRNRIRVNLRLVDLGSKVEIATGQFDGLEPASCTNQGTLAADIYGSLPAQGILEAWLLEALENAEDLPALETDLQRSGMSLIASNSTIASSLRAAFNDYPFIDFDERPAWVLYAREDRAVVEDCFYNREMSRVLTLRTVRKSIHFTLVDMQSGESLYYRRLDGSGVPECPERADDAARGGSRDLTGNLPTGDEIFDLLVELEEEFPGSIP